MILPSVDTIERILRVTRRTALDVWHTLQTFREGKTLKTIEDALRIIDMQIGGHGVEIIRSRQDTQYAFVGLTYVNMGDTYAPTVYFDHARGCFSVGSQGDVVGANGDRFGE